MPPSRLPHVLACVLALFTTVLAPGAAWTQEALCEPLQGVIAAADADFSSLGQLPVGSGVRKASGSILLPGMDSCRIHATPKSLSYVCDKPYATRAEADSALKAYDASLRACRPKLIGNDVEGIHIYEELHGGPETYLMMDLGIDGLNGKYVLSLGIGLDK